MSNKPNHICKQCGVSYYACNDCDAINSWRSACCSAECYKKYIDAVIKSRTTTIEVINEANEVNQVQITDDIEEIEE